MIDLWRSMQIIMTSCQESGRGAGASKHVMPPNRAPGSTVRRHGRYLRLPHGVCREVSCFRARSVADGQYSASATRPTMFIPIVSYLPTTKEIIEPGCAAVLDFVTDRFSSVTKENDS